MNMKPTLQELHARLKRMPMPREFVNTVLLEFLPLLKESGPLKTAYDARIHYYERLAKDEQYLVLIQTIHAVMKDIHGLIDPAKFPKRSKEFIIPSYEKWISAVEMHSLLIQKDRWMYLDHSTRKVGSKDSIFYPWRAIPAQYSKVIELIQYAINVGAVNEGAIRPYLGNLRTSLEKLEQVLAQPFDRLHIKEFEHFHIRVQEPYKLLADVKPKGFFELRDALDCICQDLLSALDVSEVEERSLSPKKASESDEAEIKLTDWTGDQQVSYQDGMLSIGSFSPTKIPNQEKSEFRRVLLELLVEDYRQKGECAGITKVVLEKYLREIGFSPKTRALVTTKDAINGEVEKAFGIRGFVRMRGVDTAFLFKKRNSQ